MKQPKHLNLPRPVPILDADEPDFEALGRMHDDLARLRAEYGGDQVDIEDLIALQRVEDA